MAASCPICARRKARRFCPARHEAICTVCCGTKRVVEIDCPSDCAYLQSAERYPPAVIKRQQEYDLGVLLATAGQLSERQLHLFFLAQSVIARFTPSGLARIVDADVADASAALAATYETATRGVIYDHQSSSSVAEGLRRALQSLLEEMGKGMGSRFEREAADVLRAIERGARHEASGLAGGGPRAYLELLGRVAPERRSSGTDIGAADTASARRLILP
ncbi:MAG: hypothetical protein ABR606_13380 [Vicinamibacterales bacterium]